MGLRHLYLLLLATTAATLGGCGQPEPPKVRAEVRGAPIASAPASRVAADSDSGALPDEQPEPLAVAAPEVALPDAAEVDEPVVPAGHMAGVHEQANALGELDGSEAPSEELTVIGDTTLVKFGDLAFAKGDTITKGDKVIPERIRALDGQRVAVDGFMIPMDFEEDEVRSLLLTRFPPGCCFGMLPAMDQWIDVEMVSEEGAEIVEMRIVRVTGTLEVGEVLDDYGYLTSVYRMDADSLVSQW